MQLSNQCQQEVLNKLKPLIWHWIQWRSTQGNSEPSILRTKSVGRPPLVVSAHVAVVVRLESLPSSIRSIRRPPSMHTQFVRHFSSSSFMNQFCGWAVEPHTSEGQGPSVTRPICRTSLPFLWSLFFFYLTMALEIHDDKYSIESGCTRSI